MAPLHCLECKEALDPEAPACPVCDSPNPHYTRPGPRPRLTWALLLVLLVLVVLRF